MMIHYLKNNKTLVKRHFFFDQNFTDSYLLIILLWTRILSSLVAAWSALPKEPAIAYNGQDSLLEGKKISISEYKGFTEHERLDALNNMVDRKHCFDIAPATCGSYVPISQMPTEELVFSALFKPRNESAPIIDAEIWPVFDELVTLLKDPEAVVSAQALEDIKTWFWTKI